MLPSAIREQWLVDEAQLGQRLNQDLQHGDRADFRLHLALLTDAVEEQPWFDPRQPAKGESRVWRSRFELPPATPLQGSANDEEAALLNERLQQGAPWWMCGSGWRCAHRRCSAPRLRWSPPSMTTSPLGRERWQGKLADQPRRDDPLLMLPILDTLKAGVDARLYWLSGC